jgi:uncharacterized protein YbjT (DUF2867 family)
MRRIVFVTGGTGYMGQRLIAALVDRGHTVRALVRPSSENRLPSGCIPVPGNALDARSYVDAIAPADTFVHLIGTPHPAPWKEREFRAVDLESVKQAAPAAKMAGVTHFVYVSVAHPAPVMKAYIAVRTECEKILKDRELRSTILRPWYVLGPGHRWPMVLQPVYTLCEWIPFTRQGALRCGLVTVEQMRNALVGAVENAPGQVIEVPGIRMSSATSVRA